MGSNPTLSASLRPARGRWASRLLVLVFSCLLAAALACPGPAAAGKIRLGAGEPIEEQILGHLTRILLEARGVGVEPFFGLDPEALRARALAGELDLYWDYTGRTLIAFQNDPDRAILRDTQKCYQTVAQRDLKVGLAWGRMAPGNNTYGLIMSVPRAHSMKVESISDLALKAKELFQAKKEKIVMGMENVFQKRPDGFAALIALYEFEYNSILASTVPDQRLLDILRTREAQVVVGPTVDGRIRRFELTVLKEDKPFFPAYNPAPVWRKEALEANPEAASIVDGLAAKLDTEALNDLRFPVEIHGHKPADSAREWARKAGLVN